MKRSGLSHEEDMFLDALDKSDIGATFGRDTIIKEMGLDNNSAECKEIYAKVFSSLLSKGIVVKSKGRGGAVKYSEKFLDDEKSIYDPFSEYLTDGFCSSYISPYDGHKIIKNTHKNKKQIQQNGKWINPDFLLVWHEKYKYTYPNQIVKTISFEIKNDYSQYVLGVFEAASHLRFVNKSYLVVSEFNNKKYKEVEQRLLTECRRLNVGLITFYHPTLFSSYKIIVEPEIRFPDPFDNDLFLSAHLEQEQLGKIQHWLG